MDWTCRGVAIRVLEVWRTGSAALGCLVGATVLVGGWGLGVEGLKTILPGLVAMKANTALGLLLCGGALWWLRRDSPSRPQGIAGDVAAALAGLLGGFTLLEYVSGLDLGLDQLLSADPATAGDALSPGRMSPLTALCFVTLSLGLLGLRRPRFFRAGQMLAVGSGFIAYMNVIAYAYSAHLNVIVHRFRWGPVGIGPGLASYTEMALHTAITLMALSIGVTAARPGAGATGIFVQETTGGAAARRLVPVAVFGPFILGAGRLAGERAGLYNLEFGLALMVTCNIVLFSLVVWWTALSLHRADARRRRAQDELRRANGELEERVRARTAELEISEARYRRLIEASVEGIFIHRGGVLEFANSAGARMFGWASPAELHGRPLDTIIAPECRPEVHARIEARLRGEDAPVTVQLEGLLRDGSRCPIETTATVVEWGGAPATQVAMVDITDRRRREAAEREAQALRSVAQLASATAHEINNPLVVILGHLSLLGKKVGDNDDARLHLERCQEAVGRITVMVRHMSRISRLEPLTLATGGVPTLDLRRSSGPVAEHAPEEPAAPVLSLAAVNGKARRARSITKA